MPIKETKSVRLEKSLYKKLKALAEDEDRKIGTLLDKAVENYLRAKKVLPLACIAKEN